MLRTVLTTTLLAAGLAASAQAQAPTRAQDSAFVRQNYTKLDRQIVMRDGVKLYTVIYVPKDASASTPYPFLMTRTPYSAGPYGEQKYRLRGPGPSRELSQEKYIFVYQDVRGRYLSEGQFEEMTPALKGIKTAVVLGPATPHDESTDTFDTIEWLLKNVPGNNGRVGMVGISYPGFYASAALPNAHPALKAVSPQAPVTDEFMGDDARHKGAFFLLDNFDFTNSFDVPRPKPVAKYEELFKFEPKDAYKFYLNLGPLKNANSSKYFNNRARIWNEYLQHENYDAYWQARNIRTALTGVKPAVLVVGGWFDAEDLFGALNTYKAIEKQNPGATNRLVMGPWTHGAWARPDWSTFGPLSFGSNVSQTFRETLETPFFNFYLKDKGSFNPAEATVFNTGTNEWKTYAAWPPAPTQARTLYFQEAGRLGFTAPPAASKPAQYVSDPANPVPYTDGVHAERNNEYMIEDQRFAAKRPDVLTFQTEPLTEDLTLAGPLTADLFVSTSGTDADFIVKVIDVLPADATGFAPGKKPTAGYQRLVRAEVMRGRYRNSFTQPEAFRPNQPTEVKYELPDVLHTFQKGHRLMVQVQSTWFPLVDRNPQKFVPIAKAEAKDFQKATIRLYHDAKQASAVRVQVVAP
ncbi:CocE/NonD family hydrolase [Hymenobacter sp. BT770]|uniref:CocE/NonD family hydrolase n=1 Tax=Hymenobacter sp. BT770 TaxID=2886942 RepID=UPI001D12735F|nr:CocE/NonD family hydrolase [Hymenobacter sp. BT770]MCC3153162.1 CocE/NonD family hydrolase [Hymenobacter sp. BT770]MDO3415364.1 CocE/NonD family hydrolase [Hymenobacter sp. BT770]